MKGLRITRLLLSVMILAATLIACDETNMDDPRQVVFGLFGAMEKNDEAALAHLLDLPALMRDSQTDYAMQREEARVFTNPEEVLKDLTGDGETKQLWFSLQRVVGTAEIRGESALVEVTFFNPEKRFYTKFGLHQKNGEWRIYSFNTMTEVAP